jgi:hypothetical protein
MESSTLGISESNRRVVAGTVFLVSFLSFVASISLRITTHLRKKENEKPSKIALFRVRAETKLVNVLIGFSFSASLGVFQLINFQAPIFCIVQSFLYSVFLSLWIFYGILLVFGACYLARKRIVFAKFWRLWKAALGMSIVTSLAGLVMGVPGEGSVFCGLSEAASSSSTRWIFINIWVIIFILFCMGGMYYSYSAVKFGAGRKKKYDGKYSLSGHENGKGVKRKKKKKVRGGDVDDDDFGVMDSASESNSDDDNDSVDGDDRKKKGNDGDNGDNGDKDKHGKGASHDDADDDDENDDQVNSLGYNIHRIFLLCFVSCTSLVWIPVLETTYEAPRKSYLRNEGSTTTYTIGMIMLHMIGISMHVVLLLVAAIQQKEKPPEFVRSLAPSEMKPRRL